MTSKASSPAEYLESLPEDRKAIIGQIRQTVLDNLPAGFSETMSYGMLTYVVPHGLYPKGYHCDPKQALPFISIASQKNHIGFYHMGFYKDDLIGWLTGEYAKFSPKKLDCGKCCLRFKKVEDIPLKLLGELCTKMTPQEWIEYYEANVKA